jgi:hypothetical protein
VRVVGGETAGFLQRFGRERVGGYEAGGFVDPLIGAGVGGDLGGELVNVRHE